MHVERTRKARGSPWVTRGAGRFDPEALFEHPLTVWDRHDISRDTRAPLKSARGRPALALPTPEVTLEEEPVPIPDGTPPDPSDEQGADLLGRPEGVLGKPSAESPVKDAEPVAKAGRGADKTVMDTGASKEETVPPGIKGPSDRNPSPREDTDSDSSQAELTVEAGSMVSRLTAPPKE